MSQSNIHKQSQKKDIVYNRSTHGIVVPVIWLSLNFIFTKGGNQTIHRFSFLRAINYFIYMNRYVEEVRS